MIRMRSSSDAARRNLPIIADEVGRHKACSVGASNVFRRRPKPQYQSPASRAEPDEGEINYPVILEALEKLKYDGFIGCEYIPRGDTDEGLTWMKRMGLR